MGRRSKATDKPKISMISGPMDAKHVAGVNIVDATGSSIDDYFTNTALEPDELPSHTFVATGKTEVLKRSDTIAHAIRRPSLSLRGSVAHLRSKSVSHPSQDERSRNEGIQSHVSLARADSVMSSQNLKTRSSISRLRRRVGLDKSKSNATIVNSPEAGEAKNVLAQTKCASPRPQSPQGDRVASSIYSTASDHIPMFDIKAISEKAPTHRSQPLVAKRLVQQDSTTTIMKAPGPPTRQHQNIPNNSTAATKASIKPQPIPFKEIMAVQSLTERMTLYETTRSYWAYADHGLVDWTGRAAAPKSANYHNG